LRQEKVKMDCQNLIKYCASIPLKIIKTTITLTKLLWFF
jgi:hypothetical protein